MPRLAGAVDGRNASPVHPRCTCRHPMCGYHHLHRGLSVPERTCDGYGDDLDRPRRERAPECVADERDRLRRAPRRGAADRGQIEQPGDKVLPPRGHAGRAGHRAGPRHAWGYGNASSAAGRAGTSGATCGCPRRGRMPARMRILAMAETVTSGSDGDVRRRDVLRGAAIGGVAAVLRIAPLLDALLSPANSGAGGGAVLPAVHPGRRRRQDRLPGLPVRAAYSTGS